MLTRRMILATGLATVPIYGSSQPFARLEAGGRLGVAVLDTGSSETLRHRASERFAMCSKFKFLLAAAVLKRIDEGNERADRQIAYRKEDNLGHSPVTEGHSSLSIEGLVGAVLRVSDKTAANLLLQTIGGPEAWTRFARSIGDSVSRLDRWELALNSAKPGDPRDTTTPEAMLKNLQSVLLGNVLTPASRRMLLDVMATSTTGEKRLKAGLPANWKIADKTGTGMNGSTNDIAAIYPPGRAPLLAAVYYTETARPDPERILAEVGRAIAAM